MKTILKIFFICGLIVITSFGCKKDKTIKTRHNSNITLYDKPPNIIQANIMGKWKLQYEKGGICATCINNNFPNYIWEFTSDNKIIQTYNDTLHVNSEIYWRKIKDVYGRSTYLMMPPNLIVNGIYNDTLVLYDNAADAVSYYLLRLN